MPIIRRTLAPALLFSLVSPGLGAAAPSVDKSIPLTDAPAAVRKTIADQMKGGTLRGLSEEADHGKTIYEAELTVEGRARDLLIDATGTVLEIEAVVEMSALPEAVRNGLVREAGRGSIARVEQVTRGEKVSYEALVKEAGKKNREIVVGQDGLRPAPRK